MRSLLALLLAFPAPALAQFHTPTVDELERLAAQDPASRPTAEDAKVGAAASFTGEGEAPRGEAVLPASAELKDAPSDALPKGPQAGKVNSYVFKGSSPLKGVNIYTPELDPTGDGSTDEPEAPEGPIKPWMTYGAIGLGAGLSVAGIFFPPLLFLGGLLLGAGAVLYFVDKKLKGE